MSRLTGAQVDRLAALADREPPPPLPAGRAADLIATALDRADRAGIRRRRRRRGAAGALIVAAVATAAAAAALWPRSSPAGAPAQATPLRLVLPTGDRLTATPGAEFGIEAAEPAERRIALRDGAMLFDVAPLPGGRLEVVTGDARVIVEGTVFTVDARGGATAVRVYEGRVRVERAGRATRLVRGEAWASSGATVDAPLAEDAEAAAARRIAVAPTVEPIAPVAASPGAPDPVDPTAGRAPVLARSSTDQGLAPSDGGAPAGGSSSPSEPEPAATPAAPTRAEVTAWIAGGDPARALAACRAADHAGDAGAWLLLEGDALRALDRPDQAAAAYTAAAARLAGDDAAIAGYQAAWLYAHRLADPAAALAALDAAAADRRGAPLEERALALRVTVLDRLGRAAAAAAAARRYLDRFPDGEWAASLRGRAGRR